MMGGIACFVAIVPAAPLTLISWQLSSTVRRSGSGSSGHESVSHQCSPPNCAGGACLYLPLLMVK